MTFGAESKETCGRQEGNGGNPRSFTLVAQTRPDGSATSVPDSVREG